MKDGGIPRNRTGAIDRALQILDALTARVEPMNAYELARVVAAPASTVYKITEELVDRAMLVRDKNGMLWLGPRLSACSMVSVP